MSELTVKQLQDKLDRLPMSMYPVLNVALREIEKDVEKKAKLNVHPGSSPYYKAPHITGNLERSISGRVVGTGKDQKAIIGASAAYAKRIHDGDSKHLSRPFIFDAIVSENPNTLKTLDEHLGDWVRSLK
ncbi:MAG: HK97 gp10 family phage protein [Gammaproteobacteria bacterium]|nr:HK97 gp10 family phage protein [Gammaproteobacteria bacterium]